MTVTIRDDLVEEWEVLCERGIKLSPEQLCRNHPELLDEVRLEIERLNAFESLFGVSCSNESDSSDKLARLFSPPQELHLSSTFQVNSCYASGGLGQIYIAEDKELGRRVAIKFPKRQGMSADQAKRFSQEAKITGQLDHPNIVPVYALDARAAGEPCYVMRFVEGKTLHEEVLEAVQNSSQLGLTSYWQSQTFRKLIQSLIAVCNATAFAHQHGVIHRDIKPNNILIGPFGETLLLDWGLAKRIETNVPLGEVSTAVHALSASDFNSSPMLTETGSTMGTPAFGSPEQIRGNIREVNARSDVFSLGATLFFVLCGKSPIEVMGWESYLRSLNSNKVELHLLLPPKLPLPLRAICAKAIRLNPNDRYDSPLSIALDLDRYLAREPISVLNDSSLAKGLRFCRKRPAFAGGAIATTFAVLLAAITTSLIVGKKNQELAIRNTEMVIALQRVQSTNDIAMEALRTMVDESVANRMSQQTELSESDRIYLQSIVSQYLKFADLESDSGAMMLIKAEALGQVGWLYYQLDQNNEAESALTESTNMYRSISAELQVDGRSMLGKFGEVLCAVQIENEQYEKAVVNATAFIENLNQAIANLSPATSDKSSAQISMIKSILFNLYDIRAKARMNLHDVELATQDFTFVAEALEQQIVDQPDNLHWLFAAGTSLRAFAELKREHAKRQSDYLEALLLSNRAIEHLSSASEASPDTHRFKSSLAWAYYDRSFIHEELMDFEQGLTDMWYASELTETIARRHPMYKSYQERLPKMLGRKSHLYLLANNANAAYSEARNMSDYSLDEDSTVLCIDLITRALEQDEDSTIDLIDAREHLSSLRAKHARLLSSRNEIAKAIESFQSSLFLLKGFESSSIHIRKQMLLYGVELLDLLLINNSQDEASKLFEDCSKHFKVLKGNLTIQEESHYQSFLNEVSKRLTNMN